ncbi:MAG TPA: phenylacetic acid degradation operon negative regulatory protein PaaX [Casimicrobiaceae bacterium]|jgi:phenylacetic acid degradation operon negative regulatory protein|nr:phenylacetic acid degradation operon negative regulatory protein PaaX [Casimicrobiaceae bacterium]
MTTDGTDSRIERWIRRALATVPPKAKSLVVTLWGDSIAPHGGAVWLSDLIGLLAPFGINERLVRTSVYRLTQEGWLAARQDGRRSLYRLTRQGQRRFEHAYRRIYAPPATDPWDGGWHLVIAPPASIDESSRRELRKELGWDGFGVLGPGLFARPARPGHEVELNETTRALGIDRRVAVVTARALPHGAASIATLTKDSWDLKGTAAAYRGFVARFRGVADSLGQGADPTPQQCFVLRTLLIHEFRRVTLHDPQLPAQLLPSNWPEAAAYSLCRELYRLTHERAERHLATMLENSRGALHSAAPYFYKRFGGL